MSFEERTAIAIERIADALENQNTGNDEEFRQRVIAVISQGIPTTLSNEIISGGYIKCDSDVITGGYIKCDTPQN